MASSFDSAGDELFDVSRLDGEWQCLRHTTLEVNASSTLLEFWSAVATFKSGEGLLFPQLTQLAAILICFPGSNATIERVFSVVGAVKTKL